MRIGLIEFLLILAIASLTIGPQVALFVDRWMRRANRANARAARRRAEYAAQGGCRAGRTAQAVPHGQHGVWRVHPAGAGVCNWCSGPSIRRRRRTMPLPVRQDTGAAQTALATDDKGTLDLGGYQNVDCIRARDGLVYAAACDGAALKKVQQ